MGQVKAFVALLFLPSFLVFLSEKRKGFFYNPLFIAVIAFDGSRSRTSRMAALKWVI